MGKMLFYLIICLSFTTSLRFSLFLYADLDPCVSVHAFVLLIDLKMQAFDEK